MQDTGVSFSNVLSRFSWTLTAAIKKSPVLLFVSLHGGDKISYTWRCLFVRHQAILMLPMESQRQLSGWAVQPSILCNSSLFTCSWKHSLLFWQVQCSFCLLVRLPCVPLSASSFTPADLSLSRLLPCYLCLDGCAFTASSAWDYVPQCSSYLRLCHFWW